MQSRRTLAGRYGTATISITNDVYIRESTPTTSNSASNALQASRDASSDTRTTLLQIPLTAVPATATIVRAQLRLWVKDTDSAMDAIFYRLLSSFVLAQATWNERSTGVSWNTAGALGVGTDYSSTPLVTQAIPTTADTLMTVDATTWVRNWLSGAWTNDGLIIRGSDPGATVLRDFHSSRASTTSFRPTLYVEYMR